MTLRPLTEAIRSGTKKRPHTRKEIAFAGKTSIIGAAYEALTGIYPEGKKKREVRETLEQRLSLDLMTPCIPFSGSYSPIERIAHHCMPLIIHLDISNRVFLTADYDDTTDVRLLAADYLDAYANEIEKVLAYNQQREAAKDLW